MSRPRILKDTFPFNFFYVLIVKTAQNVSLGWILYYKLELQLKKNICSLLFKIEILDKYFSWNNSLTNTWLSIFKMFMRYLSTLIIRWILFHDSSSNLSKFSNINWIHQKIIIKSAAIKYLWKHFWENWKGEYKQIRSRDYCEIYLMCN